MEMLSNFSKIPQLAISKQGFDPKRIPKRLLFIATFYCFPKTRIKITAYTQPLLYTKHCPKNFLVLYLIEKTIIATICLDYYVQNIMLSTADVVSSILRTKALRGKYYAYFIKGETEERDDVTCLSREARNLPCIT